MINPKRGMYRITPEQLGQLLNFGGMRADFSSASAELTRERAFQKRLEALVNNLRDLGRVDVNVSYDYSRDALFGRVSVTHGRVFAGIDVDDCETDDEIAKSLQHLREYVEAKQLRTICVASFTLDEATSRMLGSNQEVSNG